MAESLTLPAGLVAVPMDKGGCILVLTVQEYTRAIRRGKFFRRRATEAKRAERESDKPDAAVAG